MAKKIIALVVSALFLSVASVSAQTVDQATNEFLKDFVEESNPDAASNLGKFNVQNINRVSSSLFVSITGGEKVGIKGYDTYYGKGILPATTDLTASLYNRPVSANVYIADVLKNTNLIPQAYAQGIGFAGLNPILNIWKAFRNIAYFAFIIIFVVIGFMIMLRKKISSNAVVTIQEALPKIIVTLLLITFSYAIAGLVIDIMYLSIFVLTGVLQAGGLIRNANEANNVLFGRNIIGIGISYFTGFTEASGMAAEAMGQLVAQVFGGLLGVVANVIFYLIFAIAILIAVFRAFIQLLTAYVGIILSTIFAPLQLLPNAFPGSDAFGKWFNGLIANAAVFPVAAAMILLGAILTTTSGGADNLGLYVTDNPSGFEYDGFMPPLLYGTETNTGSTSAVKVLIGFGIIMMLPEVLKITREAFQVKDAGYSGAAMGGAASGLSLFTGAERIRQQEAQKIFYKRQLEGKNPQNNDLSYLERIVVNPLNIFRPGKK
jgi:hypothetical protein